MATGAGNVYEHDYKINRVILAYERYSGISFEDREKDTLVHVLRQRRWIGEATNDGLEDDDRLWLRLYREAARHGRRSRTVNDTGLDGKQ